MRLRFHRHQDRLRKEEGLLDVFLLTNQPHQSRNVLQPSSLHRIKLSNAEHHLAGVPRPEDHARPPVAANLPRELVQADVDFAPDLLDEVKQRWESLFSKSKTRSQDPIQRLRILQVHSLQSLIRSRSLNPVDWDLSAAVE